MTEEILPHDNYHQTSLRSPQLASLAPDQEKTLGRVLDFRQSPEGIKARQIYHVRTDAETERRDAMRPLDSNVGWVRVDQDGRLYLEKWALASIPKDGKILGTPRPGWDYTEHPPKNRESQRLVFSYYPQGIDVLLRAVSKIRDRYRLRNVSIGSESWQTLSVFNRLNTLQQYMMQFKNLSMDDMERIAQENAQLLEDFGLTQPKGQEKQKMSELLGKKWVDSMGRKNYLLARNILYGIKRELLTRIEGTHQSTVTKYGLMAEELSFHRDATRIFIAAAADQLGALVDKNPFLQNPSPDLPDETWISEATQVYQELRGIVTSLNRQVRARPYKLATDVLIERSGTRSVAQFSIDNFGNRHERLIWRRQQFREGLGVPTAHDFLREGDFENTRLILEDSQQILVNVLNKNEDYLNLKPSSERRKYPPKRKRSKKSTS